MIGYHPLCNRITVSNNVLPKPERKLRKKKRAMSRGNRKEEAGKRKQVPGVPYEPVDPITDQLPASPIPR